MLYVCPADQTILLLQRSQEVEQPGSWGIPGGAVHGTEGFHDSRRLRHETPPDVSRASAEREAFEELGTQVSIVETLGSSVYTKGGFRYVTYVVSVTPEEKARLEQSISLNWENDDWDWFSLAKLPRPLHFGVNYTLSQVNVGSLWKNKEL